VYAPRGLNGKFTKNWSPETGIC